MRENDHISLRLARISQREPWNTPGPALSFIFPKSGIGEFTLGTKRYPLNPGGILVVKSPAGGAVGPANGGEMLFWHFKAAFEHMVPLFAGQEICLLPNVIERFRVAKAYLPTTPLARECHKLLAEVPSVPGLSHRGQLLRIVATILSEEFQAVENQPNAFTSVGDRMRNAFEDLSTDELLNLSVEKLASRLGYSRRHLTRLFQQHFGTSVVALRTEMRLLKAVSLLRDPGAKIICVAQESGFNHLGLFHHCFKKRFGSSPGQWRSANA